MNNKKYLGNNLLENKIIKNNYKTNSNYPDKSIIRLLDDDYFHDINFNNEQELNKDLLENEYILNIIEKTIFLTPDILTDIFNSNKTLEENNFALLQLASIFGGPLLKTNYSILDNKYVYTNKNSYINKKTLDGFNKASYLICALNKNAKVVDIKTFLKYQNDEFYTLIKVKLVKNEKYKTINIVLNSNDLKYYENFNKEKYLNIEKIGYLLKRIDTIVSDIFLN